MSNDAPPVVSAPPIGAQVLYRLTASDAHGINRRREQGLAHLRLHSAPDITPGHPGASGHVLHTGNHAAEGDQYPGRVVRTFNPNTSSANLHVDLDGNDALWATSATHGDGPGRWQYNPLFHPALVVRTTDTGSDDDADSDVE